jgi:hypothetical protein
MQNIKKASKAGMDSVNMFKAIIKAFTGESLNNAVNDILIKGEYD